MLLDLLSLDNYVSYNIKVAELLGLHTAIYLSELMNINEKAVKKAKITDHFFTVDRKYITQRTTLTKQEQLKIDKQLTDLGLLKLNEENNSIMTLNIGLLISMLTEDNKFLADIKKQHKLEIKPKKQTKEESLKSEMKQYVTATNTELYNAYMEWIDSVFHKLHWMSKKSVEVAQHKIDEYSNHNLDVALKILEIATINGYKDITWAIKVYKEQYEASYRIKYARTSNSSVLPKTDNCTNTRSASNLSEEVF